MSFTLFIYSTDSDDYLINVSSTSFKVNFSHGIFLTFAKLIDDLNTGKIFRSIRSEISEKSTFLNFNS